MSVKLLDGKALAAQLKEALRKEVDALKEKTGKAPVMKSILVADDPAAVSYANSQKKIAESVGIHCQPVSLASDVSQRDLAGLIQQLNDDRHVHGIMIYKPLPGGINYGIVANMIAPAKDIEGTHTANLGKLMLGEAKIIPATAAAVMEHIKSTGVSLRGKEAVIVGRSEIVGKPLALLLLGQSATVTVCHTGTKEAGTLEGHIGRADILVAAVGKAEMIKGQWIKKGSIVIDVGINKVADKIKGDVEFETAAKRAAYITPVPGGVGPVTAVMMMKNIVEAFKLQNQGAK